MQGDDARRARALAEATERKVAALRAEGVTDKALAAAGLLPRAPASLSSGSALGR
jgi:hypothetical protein